MRWRRRSACLLAVLLWHGAATAAVLPRGMEEINPEGEVLVHPEQSRIETPPLGGQIGRGLLLCAYYGTTKKSQRGKISVRAEIHRDGQVIESVEFGGRIKNAEKEDGEYSREFLRCSKPTCPADSAVGCETEPDLEFETVPEKGDVFVFHLTYRKLRPLNPGEVAEVTVGPYPRSGS